MAGTKNPRVKDDRAKKRKRETNDRETIPKRHRRQSREGKVNGADAPTPQKIKHQASENGTQSKHLTYFCPQEVVRQSDDGEAGWRISKPMGGRMMDIDPILTEDEQHLIITYNTSIQIYTTADSLLVRRIPISTLDTSSEKGSTPARIIATRLSKSNSHLAWVACSDGNMYCVDWSQSVGPSPVFRTTSGTANALVVVPAAYAENKEILLISESDKASHMDIVAYQPISDGKAKSKALFSLKKQGHGLQILETSMDGQVIIGAFQDQLFFGNASRSTQNLEELEYDVVSFESPDLITCIDLRLRHRSSGSTKNQPVLNSTVDVIVGGARGGIYIYRDALSTIRSSGKSQSGKDGLDVQNHHWHRKAVHAVKWSRDGNYFISGGSENVLVVWQVDTSKKDFLPHLSASVENIVVSTSGSSYVLHLDDNSAMILSTAEMKPTSYISGIQSAATDMSEPKDLLVRRVWNTPEQVRRPIPAAIRPSEPSKLHVCVGNGRQATMSGDISAPMLQSFDLESFTSVSKQALARTHPTDVNLSSKGHPFDEPLVTSIAFSGNGLWLASVDEWRPTEKDMENISADLRDQFIHERREIYLKFWEVRNGGESIALVSRINAPHATNFPEIVLDLASDPTSSAFATIGADGVARLWRPRVRQNNGVTVKDEHGHDEFSWACAQAIAIGDCTSLGDGMDLVDSTYLVDVQGSISFSEDGSTLFVAFGAVDCGVVHVVDVASGRVAQTLEGLWDGKLQSIRALSSYIIVLSNDLRVYDVVGDELRYGIDIPKISGVSELLQLAVDYTSGHFAVTLPIGRVSSIGVFDPEDPEPLLVRTTPHRIVSLVSAPATSGFIAIDDAAQVWVIAEGSDPASLATVQPLQDLQLDDVPEVLEKDVETGGVLVGEDMDVASEDEIADGENGIVDGDHDVNMYNDDDDDDDDDDGININVIPRQSLTDIFDIAPAFAAPSIEDMFYKVTGLLATKPLAEQ
ncbi:NET1-associated nuclear protein 1 [Conoideocrella luteorostrata]|uniref:NET1-associated nuclear protein 1 n=1 Tax=Conoideocrella luteorostrata TaxID=1105319 RepID=A0AAJ0CG00_9HYPO|nr:NET1-associated nuclear protein 1 [Conoideocrella luteorostrata]